MKIIFTLIGVAILLSSGVMLFLVKRGAALRPAGVIAPTEISAHSDLIEKAVSLRLFPDFQTAKNVIWFINTNDEPYVNIPQNTLLHYQTNFKPTLVDLRLNTKLLCHENCWFVQAANVELPANLAQKLKTEPTVEIFVQYFERDEPVPEICESEKTLELKCVRPISVREVRKKMKTQAPYFFMRRYLDSQFYLFIERIK